jgi:hypothetical protein
MININVNCGYLLTFDKDIVLPLDFYMTFIILYSNIRFFVDFYRESLRKFGDITSIIHSGFFLNPIQIILLFDPSWPRCDSVVEYVQHPEKFITSSYEERKISL